MHKDIYKNDFKTQPSMAHFVEGTERLVDSCWSRDRFSMQGKGQDNVTAILVEFNHNHSD